MDEEQLFQEAMDTIARNRAGSPNPVELDVQEFLQTATAGGMDAQDEAYKLLSSAMLERYMGRPAKDIYQNWDAAVLAWSGAPEAPKNLFDKLALSWNAGAHGVKLGTAWSKWRDARLSGNKEAEEAARKEIEALKAAAPDTSAVLSAQPKTLPGWIAGKLEKGVYGGTELLGQMTTNTLTSIKNGYKTGGALAIGGAALDLVTMGKPIRLIIPSFSAAAFSSGMLFEHSKGTFTLESGLALDEMMEWKDDQGRGIDEGVAIGASMAIGYVNTLIESGQEILLAYGVPSSGEIAEKAITAAVKKGIVSQGLQKALAAISSSAITRGASYLIGEATQEGAQEAVTVLSGEIAKEISNQVTGTTLRPSEVDAIAGRIRDAWTESLLSFAVIGGAGAAGRAGLRGGAKVAAGAINARVQAEDAQAMQALETAFSGQAEEGGREIERTPEGGIRTQAKDLSTTEGQAGIVYAGAATTGERYGYARYRVEGERVIIEDLALEEDSALPATTEEDEEAAPGPEPLKDSLQVRKALLEAVAEQNPGLEIDFEPRTSGNRAAMEAVIAENPRGPEAGLQWFEADADVAEVRDFGAFKARMASVFKHVSSEKIDVMADFVQRRASRIGLTADAYVRKAFSPQAFTSAMPADAARAAAQRGKNPAGINGTTVFRDARALIYAAEGADFRTLSHEMIHAWHNEVLETGGADKVALEKAFGVTDGNWDAIGDRGVSKYEELAYSWERFLETGEAKTPEIKTLLQKVAAWMKSVYTTLASRITVSPEVRDAFEQMFADPESVVNQAEAAVAAAPREDMPLFQDIEEVRDKEGRLLAPNGKPSRLSEFQWKQVRTDAFKAWFGDWENDPASASKVIDENGEPRVVYHGTPKGGFQAFDSYKAGSNTANVSDGFYFTENRMNAQTYSNSGDEITDQDIARDDEAEPYERNQTKGIYSVYLNLRNPYIYDAQGRSWDGSLEGEYDGIGTPIPEIENQIFQDDENDGAIILNVQDEGRYGQGYNWGEITYIAKAPEQIKSATYNSGAFDPSDDRILFQERDVENVVYSFPPELKGYSDIHSPAQVSGILNVFGRGVVDKAGNIRLGDAGASHVSLAQGMQDAKRFYFGYSRDKKAAYLVAKNGIDEAFLKSPKIQQAILSQVFDKYRLAVAQGKRLAFRDILFQEEIPKIAQRAFDSAIEEMGETDNVFQAGYLLPDGRMLNFSEPRGGGDRDIDHRSITWKGSEKYEIKGENYGPMRQFIKWGAIRMDANNGLLDMAKRPTHEQYAIIRELVEVYDREIWLDLEKGKERFSKEGLKDYEWIKRFIEQFYNGTIRFAEERWAAENGEGDDEGRVLFQEEDGWIYKGEQVVSEKMKGPMPGRQILKMLQAAGVKAEEMRWTELDTFLDTDEKKTPQEVKDYLAGSKLQIDEKNLTDEKAKPYTLNKNSKYYSKAIQKLWDSGSIDRTNYEDITLSIANDRDVHANLTGDFDPEFVANNMEEIIKDLFGEEHQKISQSKYGSYVLRGGKNYREILFTLPTENTEKLWDEIARLEKEARRLNMAGEREKGRQLLDQSSNIRARIEMAAPYKSPHWEELNVLAHTRVDDRVDTNGRKMLFIEEIQSDWHQEGRKKGYKTSEEYYYVSNKLSKNTGMPFRTREEAEKDLAGMPDNIRGDLEIISEVIEKKGVPIAPFSKTWHEFVFKRLLREAAEQGYQVIGWTTGEQQAERYDLSKHIKDYSYGDGDTEGVWNITVITNDDKTLYDGADMTDAEIEDTFGAGILKRMKNHEGEKHGGYYQLRDLTLGGEGMKGFYDKILVDYVNKYAKRWGVNVENIGIIDATIEADGDQFKVIHYDGKTENIYYADTIEEAKREAEKVSQKVHSLPVTEEMRKSIIDDGQVLFQLADDELSSIAAEATDWQDFRDRVEAEEGADSPTKDLSPEERDFWYQAQYERLTAEQAQAATLTPEQADEAFADMIPNEVEGFLKAIYDATVTNWSEMAPEDAEEAAAFDERAKTEARLQRQAHPTILNAARTIGRGNELTPGTRARVITLMRKKGARTFYRRWYASLTGDQAFAVDAEADAALLPDIEELQSQESSLSIEGKLRILEKIKDKELRRKLASGEVVPEADVAEYLGRLEEEKASVDKALAEAEAKLAETMQELKPHERRELARQKWRAELKAKIEKQSETLRKGLEAGDIDEALLMERNKNREYLAEIDSRNAPHADVAKTAEVYAAEKAVAETKAHIRDIADRKKAALQIRNLKIQLADAVMRKPPKGVSYDKVQAIEAIQALLDPHFRRARIEWNSALYTLEDARKNIDTLRQSGLPLDIVERLQKKHLGEWTISELEGLALRVDELIRQGKQERDFEIFTWKVERLRAMNAAQRAVLSSGKYRDPESAGSEERAKQMKKLDNLGRRLYLHTENARRVARELDGGVDGANVDLLILERRRAEAAKMANVDRRLDAVHAAMKQAKVSVKDLYSKKATIAGVGPGGKAATFTMSDLMYIYLGLRDEDTRAAIAFGNLMDQDERANLSDGILKMEGDSRLAKLADAVATELGPEYRAVAEAIAADFRDEFGRMNEVFIREFNYAMAGVANYVPMIRQDITASGEKHEAQQAKEVLQVGGVTIKNAPEKGFTIERIKIGMRKQRAIRLDLYGTWMQAVEREEHFTAYTHYIRTLNAVYKGMSTESKLLKDSIVNSYGASTMKYVNDYINEIANPQSMEGSSDSDKFARVLRGALHNGYLGYNIASIVKQGLTSPMPFLAYVNPLDMAAASFEATFHHKQFYAAVKQSTYMKHRTMSPAMADIQKAKQGAGPARALAEINDLGMKGLTWIDWASVSVGWKAVYNRVQAALAKNLETIRLGDTEYRLEQGKDINAKVWTPVEIADDVVLKSQPTGDKAELSPLFKIKGKGGAFVQAFTQFQSALNVIWQNFTSDIPNAIKHKQIGYAIRAMTSYAIAGILVGLVTKGREDDDDKMADDILYWSMTQATDSTPLIGNYVTNLWKKVATGEQERVYQSSLYPAADELFRAAGYATQEEWTKAGESFAEGLALGIGLPVSGAKQVKRAFEIGPKAFLGRRE